MSAINSNQEWDFIIAETHGEKPSRTNLAKREMLFALQILLAQIGLVTKAGELHSLRQNYSTLKEVYHTEK